MRALPKKNRGPLQDLALIRKGLAEPLRIPIGVEEMLGLTQELQTLSLPSQGHLRRLNRGSRRPSDGLSLDRPGQKSRGWFLVGLRRDHGAPPLELLLEPDSGGPKRGLSQGPGRSPCRMKRPISVRALVSGNFAGLVARIPRATRKVLQSECSGGALNKFLPNGKRPEAGPRTMVPEPGK